MTQKLALTPRVFLILGDSARISQDRISRYINHVECSSLAFGSFGIGPDNPHDIKICGAGVCGHGCHQDLGRKMKKTCRLPWKVTRNFTICYQETSSHCSATRVKSKIFICHPMPLKKREGLALIFNTISSVKKIPESPKNEVWWNIIKINQAPWILWKSLASGRSPELFPSTSKILFTEYVQSKHKSPSQKW